MQRLADRGPDDGEPLASRRHLVGRSGGGRGEPSTDDGAELAMAEKPRYVRSSVRDYPYAEQRDGMVAQDMDGDGSDEVPPQSGWLSQQQSLACSRLNI